MKSSKVGGAKTSRYYGVPPRAPCIKRTACLNAGAIMSAMYRYEPVIKKPKIERSKALGSSDSDKVITETDSKPPQSPKKPGLHADKVGSPKKVDSPKKKDKDNKPPHSPKKQELDKPVSPKEVQSPKKEDQGCNQKGE